MNNPIELEATIIEGLFPKVVTNYVSKLPEFESTSYSNILETLRDESIPFNDRLVSIANTAGNIALVDSLVTEAGILKLCATGREAEVDNPARQAEYTRSDTNQINSAQSTKTLDFYLENGIEVIFKPEHREAAQRYCDIDTRNVPLIEKLKAKRLFSINGFNESRVMYAVHDLIDHAWLFQTMRDRGLLDRYNDFLQAVDMRESTFLYSRQAELLASVGFGARRWVAAQSQREEMILDAETVTTVLRTTDDPRATHAAQLLKDMQPKHRAQAMFMIENMAVQFADERRRWGAVKQQDTFTRARKPMRLLEPLHIALMIETLDMLQKSRQYGAIQLAATVEIEDILQRAISGTDSSDHLYVPVPSIGQTTKESKSDSEAWIMKHLSVSTSYNHIKDKEDS